MRKKVLGRGLEALISRDLKESVSETERVMELEVDLIDPNPNQPRKDFDGKNLEELAASIRENGVLQPVVVRRAGERYELIVGERRFRASALAGKRTLPAIVRDVGDDESLRFALMENLQREDLNPVEEARGYMALQEGYGMSVKEIAAMIGKDRSTVANTLRLLNLPEKILLLLQEGRLKAGHARALLSIEGEKAQLEWAGQVIENGFSVREIETSLKRKKDGRRRSRKRSDPMIREMEERAERVFGTRVRIVERKKGGVVSIEYYSSEELEGILEKMGVETQS